jgi:nucleotide-binding universal stress UspA family protein
MSGFREFVTLAPFGDRSPETLQVTEMLVGKFGGCVHFVHGLRRAALELNISTDTESDLRRLRALAAEDASRVESERNAVTAAVESWRRRTGATADLTIHDSAPELAISRLLMTADLAVLPRPDSDAHLNIKSIVLESGRPVLLALGQPPVQLCNRVAIFWRRTPATSRAVAAAMPFLHEASSVALLATETEAGDHSLERAATWLESHGVNAQREEVRLVGGASVGDTLLAAASEFRADMIVMGAYGHSRLHDWVLGSVTSHVLHTAWRLVFTCH